ncbi:MAG: ATP-binding protein [Candidatus Cloacimonetes bacterium]|nr:ATP-binding protein [Candidatus Cloacimonadota bacterium]
MVKELMNAIKGTVEVESRLNRGTKITLRLNQKMLE